MTGPKFTFAQRQAINHVAGNLQLIACAGSGIESARWLRIGSAPTPYADETEIAMDILRQGDQVTVLSPPSLVSAVSGRLESAAAQYRH
ncbi:MAG: hypothetical protein M9907_04000 [Burkholderiaceae bacterium]|nr:hypothetical protein [Burkholderiaceae bacterium]